MHIMQTGDAALRHLDPNHDTDLRGHGGIELSLSIENPHGDDTRFATLTWSMAPPIPGSTILPGIIRLARCSSTRRSLRPHRRNDLGQKRATAP